MYYKVNCRLSLKSALRIHKKGLNDGSGEVPPPVTDEHLREEIRSFHPTASTAEDKEECSESGIGFLWNMSKNIQIGMSYKVNCRLKSRN